MELVNYNLIEDLSKLTTIPKNSLAKLSDIARDIVASDVRFTVLGSKDDVSAIDIGIGTLYIGTTNNIEYKFVPSQAFESLIKEVVVNKVDPIVNRVDEALVNRILNTYKDLL